ncbi:MAG: contractile injection system tape measure protein, partial [Bacteroidota bacterium]
VEHHRLRLNSQSLRQRSNLYPIDSKEEIIASTPNQYLSEQWLFFLENGYLPWWAPKSPTAEDLSLGIYEVLRLPHTTLREKLLALIHYSKTARIRLARDVRHQPIFRILLGQSKALTKLYQDWKSVMTTVVQRHQADATTDKISQVPQDWDYWARFHLWPALLELPSRHESTSAVTAAFFDSVWPGLNHWSVEKVQNFTTYWSQKQRQQLLPVIWPKLSQAAIEYLLVESPLRESTFKKGQTKAEEEVTNREVEGVRTEVPGEDQAVKEVLTNQDIDQRAVEETFEEGQSIEQPEELTGAIDATTKTPDNNANLEEHQTTKAAQADTNSSSSDPSTDLPRIADREEVDEEKINDMASAQLSPPEAGEQKTKTAEQRSEESSMDALLSSTPDGSSLLDGTTSTSYDESTKADFPVIALGTTFYTNHAGVVLVHPFLVPLFTELGYWQNEDFVDELAQQRAVFLTYYLATAHTELVEEELVLSKLLCGWPISGPVRLSTPLTTTELREAEELLQAVITHWGAIGKASPAGLREGFFAREGKISRQEMKWEITVDRKAQDLLLGKLPWGISLIKTPWREELIHVSW